MIIVFNLLLLILTARRSFDTVEIWALDNWGHLRHSGLKGVPLPTVHCLLPLNNWGHLRHFGHKGVPLREQEAVCTGID